jgi:hypothetical protein
VTTMLRDEHRNRCIAYLLCKSALLPDFASLRAEMEARFPALSEGMELLSSDLFEGSGYAFVVGGVPLSLIVVPAPLPRTEWEVGAAANLAWPKAAETVSAHRAHIIVSPIAALSDRRDALVKHTVLTAVSAVVADVVKALGVCWVPAFTVIKNSALQRLAEAMLENGKLAELPLDLWMRLEFGRMDGRYAAVVRGLRPFCGHDLGITSETPDPAMQGRVLYEVAGHLMRTGTVIKSGDTLDAANGPMRAAIGQDGSMLWLELVVQQGRMI